ncbi:MAG TPA: ATP-binding protein [Polyangiaceae bacterium]|nr:ATP-binding protein [Polyangiaceae bacterium]
MRTTTQIADESSAALRCTRSSREPREGDWNRQEVGKAQEWEVILKNPWNDPPGVDASDRAEQARHANERNLKLVIDALPALVWAARPDGSAEFFSQRYLDFIGLSAERAVDSGWMAAVHPDDSSALADCWAGVLASATAGEAEARVRRYDGEYRWFLFRVNPLRDEAGVIVKWYGVSTDIEDRKRAQTELEHAYDRSFSALTASIAHEVNQPLSGIITNAGTCLRMLDAPSPNLDAVREVMRRLVRDSRRAGEVIQGLRALFSSREFAPEPLDLNEAAREVIALSSNDLQRNRVILQSELADALPLVKGDRIQLQQVIVNLLRNAIDAMAGVHVRPRQLLIKTAKDAEDRVRLSIRDSGVGLSTQNFDSIFEAFHTTKRGGMGIGLFVSRSIIERHRGRLWVTANDGPGATFSFSIPRE